MGAMVVSQAEFESTLRRVNEALEKFGDLAQSVIKDCRRWSFLAGPYQAKIEGMLIDLWHDVQRVFEVILAYTANPGQPWSLWSKGSVWSGPLIAQRIGDQASKATVDGTRLDEHWEGTAAVAYKNMLWRQQPAIAALAKQAQDIDDILGKLSVALWGLLLAIITAAIAIIIELIGSAAAASTGAGAPPAAAATAVSVAKFLGIVSAVLDAFYVFALSQVLPDIKDLRQQLYNNVAYGDDGTWPRSTSDMSDAVVGDNDESDWRLIPR